MNNLTTITQERHAFTIIFYLQHVSIHFICSFDSCGSILLRHDCRIDVYLNYPIRNYEYEPRSRREKNGSENFICHFKSSFVLSNLTFSQCYGFGNTSNHYTQSDASMGSNFVQYCDRPDCSLDHPSSILYRTKENCCRVLCFPYNFGND